MVKLPMNQRLIHRLERAYQSTNLLLRYRGLRGFLNCGEVLIRGLRELR